MEITLTSFEVEYLKMLLADTEPTLFAESLVSKLSNPPAYLAPISSRRSDPNTSKAAGASVAMRSGSQKQILLETYALTTLGFTDEEAGINSGLAHRPKCCYWKRCSELRQAGLIAPNGQTRLSSVGEPQQVCVITEAGLQILGA